MGKTGGIPRLGWAVAFLVVATLIALAYSSFKGMRASPASARLAPISLVPDFELFDQTGKPFSLADLKGKIWAASFLFTRCKGPCAVINSRMAELNKIVERAGNDVELVSFTTDPGFDRPDILAAYSAKLGADPAHWKFLTGTQEAIESVVLKGLLQPLKKAPDSLSVPSTRIVLVDRDGRLRGYEDGEDPEAVQKLLMDIGELLRESPSRHP